MVMDAGLCVAWSGSVVFDAVVVAFDDVVVVVGTVVFVVVVAVVGDRTRKYSEVAQGDIIICYEEQGEHYVAQRYALAAKEKEFDKKDEQLRQCVEMESAFA